MADASAARLAELLLSDDLPRRCDALAELLAKDPPLTLWAVCTAANRDDFRPRCIDELAGWLVQHLLDVLQFPESDAEGDGGPDRQTCGRRVAETMQVADLAARLASSSLPHAQQPSFLAGLLHDADGWLSIAGESADENSSCLPDWLMNPVDMSGADCVKQAVDVLGGESPPPEIDGIDLEACRQRAEEAGRRWSATVEGPGEWLPKLTAKLARLSDLEGRFQELLETEKLEAMAEFAAGAGHEINNPLTVIAGRAQLFLSEETDPERRRALALMNSQAKRVYEMIADMMLFARPPRPELEPVDLAALVDGLVEELAPAAARQEIAIRRSDENGSVEIEADPVQLTVALRALCRNAVEAIGREGSVQIELRDCDCEVEIRVRDDGPGFPTEERRHVFDPYYSARQAGRGLGLGLSKCWRIITNHGGKIDAESRPGHGAEFLIKLPRRRTN